jgi:hypothetical protein
MATLKQLFAEFNAASLDFRNNEQPDANNVMWANAFVTDKDGGLICIGATADTLAKIQAEPEMSNLMLTKPEKKISAKNGNEYKMCQLAIAKPADFSFSL